MSYLETIPKVLTDLESSASGLTSEEAKKRLKKYGPNAIVSTVQFKALKEFLKQFLDPLAIILLGAGVLSVVFGEIRDAIIIFCIVLINAVIGFSQEYKAEKAIQALKKLIPATTTVRRNGKEEIIEVEGLVPGDIVVLGEGANIPADLRLIEANDFWTNDVVLTGESEPQEKRAQEEDKKDLSLTNINNMVFMGMSVIKGNALGVVVSTGMDTEFGKIAGLTQNIQISESPLQKEVEVMARTIIRIVGVVVAFIFIVGLFSHKNFFDSFSYSLGVAAALVPEGLAATITIALAVGVTRMARKNSIIKKLSAVETLGCTSVIVTDKTGTLTKNEMTVKEVYVNGRVIHVEGVGNIPVGRFTCDGTLYESHKFEKLLNAGVLCNEAEIERTGEVVKIIGDQTEGALLVMAEKAGVEVANFRKENKIIHQIPFDSERKMMSVVSSGADGIAVYSKGAPGVILEKSKFILVDGKVRVLTNSDKQKILKHNDLFAESALRVLAFAYKPESKKKEYNKEETESELVFVGLAGMIDPPKPEVREAISHCRKAGIEVIMVTGDYGLTAMAVGKRIGLFEETEPRVITGQELNVMPDYELMDVLGKGNVLFARVDPSHKMRIVSALQSLEKVVAVTGDGVNDAPALKKADVGVAMGIAGTDVSKEAAEMIITDDNFSSIVKAIHEGRIVYDNLKKFILYILSSNGTEFFSVMYGLVLGINPILALQILFIDLGTDVLPSMALAVDPGDPAVMERAPRDPKEKLLNREVFNYLLKVGVVGATLATVVFLVIMFSAGFGLSVFSPVYSQATTAVYATLVACQLVNSFLCRKSRKGVVSTLLENKRLLIADVFSIILLLNVVYNPFFQKVFETSALGPWEWILVILSGILFLLISKESRKVTKKKET